MTWLDVAVLAIVEGITEFLPVSSTGHMIIAQSLLGIENSEFIKTFIVSIQFGTILSVVLLYWKKFLQSLNFYYKLFIAFIPAVIFGFLLGKHIDNLLENVIVVAVSLIVGGIILLFADKWFNKPDEGKQEITYMKALKIGFFQCIAMIPGVSRSASTIIGGMTQKLTRKNAAEFSFFLAVPTMLAATGYKLLKTYKCIDTQNVKFLLGGNIIAFIIAMIAIKSFISVLTKYGFRAFGYYRIIVGTLLLVLIALGFDLKII